MFKKIIAIFSIIATLFSFCTIYSSAANACNSISGKPGEKGGQTTTFYAGCKDTKSHYIKITQTKGTLTSDAALTKFQNKDIYDYLTIRVYGQKSGKWVKLSDVNYKNKSSIKVQFSGYKEYKIEVHSWKTETIEKTEVFWPHMATKKPWAASSAYWLKQPSWSVSKTSGLTDCDSFSK